MKKLIFALAFLFLAQNVNAQITCAAANWTTTGVQTAEIPTVASATNIASGDLLILAVAERDQSAYTVDSISGTTSGSWSTTEISSSSSGAGIGRWYYKISTAAGADTISVDLSTSRSTRLMYGRCTVTGSTPTLDVADATPATGSSTAPATDSVTPTNNGTAISFIHLGGDQTMTSAGTGGTILITASRGALGVSKSATGGAGVSIGPTTIDGTRDWAAHIAVFSQGGGAAPAPKLMTLGVGLW